MSDDQLDTVSTKELLAILVQLATATAATVRGSAATLEHEGDVARQMHMRANEQLVGVAGKLDAILKRMAD